MKHHAVAAAVLALATACSSGGGDAGKAGRTVEIAMTDIAFTPAAVTVARGETVTFRFTNNGKLKHDAFLGDAAAQAEHEKEMGAGGGHGGHGGDDAITVDPGKTGTLTHTFEEAGTTEIGCHEPGHYAAGMKVVVTVTA